MQNRTDKSREKQTKAPGNQPPQKKDGGKAAFSFVDNRPEASQLAEIQLMANNSAQAQHLQAMQEMADYSPQARNLSGMQALADNSPRMTAQQQQIGNTSGPAHEPPETLEEGQNEPLQGGIAASGTPVQLQGETGSQENEAPSAPGHVEFKPLGGYGLEGIGYSTMTNQAYADWQDTIQCKAGLHGAASHGGITAVTQFLNPAETTQMAGFLGATAKGSLLIAEGLLAITAGIALTTVTGGALVTPGAIAIGIGVVKVGRGILTIYAGDEPTPGQKAAIDAIRGLEAAVSIAAAAVTGKPAVVVFAVAKSIRAVLTAITDYMGDQTEWAWTRKGLLGLAAAAHAVEVGALAATGGLLIKEGGASKIVAGAAIIATAGLKVPRALDQGWAAYRAPGRTDQQGADQAPGGDPLQIVVAQQGENAIPAVVPQEEAPENVVLPGVVPQEEGPENVALPGVVPQEEGPENVALPGVVPQEEAPENVALPAVVPQEEAPENVVLPGVVPQEEGPENFALPAVVPQEEAPENVVLPGVVPQEEAPENVVLPGVVPQEEGPENVALPAVVPHEEAPQGIGAAVTVPPEPTAEESVPK